MPYYSPKQKAVLVSVFSQAATQIEAQEAGRKKKQSNDDTLKHLRQIEERNRILRTYTANIKPVIEILGMMEERGKNKFLVDMKKTGFFQRKGHEGIYEKENCRPEIRIKVTATGQKAAPLHIKIDGHGIRLVRGDQQNPVPVQSSRKPKGRLVSAAGQENDFSNIHKEIAGWLAVAAPEMKAQMQSIAHAMQTKNSLVAVKFRP